MLRICLPKSISTADKCWNSLLKDKYVADPFTFDQMEKKLTLQRFQYEVGLCAYGQLTNFSDEYKGVRCS